MAPALLRSLTHVQYRMLRLLADGREHGRMELHACLEDELGAPSNIHQHLSTLRPKIRRFGLDLCTKRNGPMEGTYRLVRLVGGGDPRKD